MFRLAKGMLTPVLFFAAIIAAIALGAFLSFRGLFAPIFGEPVVQTNVVAILESVQGMSQVTTTRYTYSLIITSERDMPPLLQGLYGERLVMVAVGHVTAGIDLSQLEEGDIQVVGDTLILEAPTPQLQECFFNESQSYVVSRDTGLFARPLPNLDDQSRDLALRYFRDAAVEDNIIEEARTQTEITLEEFLGLFPGDFTQVRVVVPQADPNAPLPASCN